MADLRSESKGRRSARGLLAIGIGCTLSIVIPNLYGDPPNGNRPKEDVKESKVQIRFQGSNSAGQGAVGSAEIPAGQKGSKLTSDVARGNSNELPQQIGKNSPITVATEEEKNQKIAVDWKDPLFVFFVTGNQTGYIEPCGCTGLENQKGGLSRRDSFLTSVRKRGWEVIPIDGGGQVFQVSDTSPRPATWPPSGYQICMDG